MWTCGFSSTIYCRAAESRLQVFVSRERHMELAAGLGMTAVGLGVALGSCLLRGQWVGTRELDRSTGVTRRLMDDSGLLGTSCIPQKDRVKAASGKALPAGARACSEQTQASAAKGY